MSLFSSTLIQSFLNIPVVSQVRRNHGLEHATLSVLSSKYPLVRLVGHSGPDGFWIIGDIPIQAVREASDEALLRMRAGEQNLAVHQNCGTNFVTAGMLAGLAAGLPMMVRAKDTRQRMERLPLAMVLATLAVIIGYPFGTVIQEHVTTSGQPGNLQITDIIPSPSGKMNAYRVRTRG